MDARGIKSIYDSLFGYRPADDDPGFQYYLDRFAGEQDPNKVITAIAAGAQGGDAQRVADLIAKEEAAGRSPIGFDINQDGVVSSADLAFIRGLNEPAAAPADVGGDAPAGGGGTPATETKITPAQQEALDLRNYITDLYTTQLDRTPSETEIQGWINRYNDPTYVGDYTLDTLKEEFSAGAGRELGLRARQDYYSQIPKFTPSKVPQFQFPTAAPPRPILGLTGLAGAQPKTINDLYQEVLNRAPDQGGLDYYTPRFGSTIEPNEVAEFVGGVEDPAERAAAQAASRGFLNRLPLSVPQGFSNLTSSYAQPISAAIQAREAAAAAAPTTGVRAGGVINYAEGGAAKLAEPTSPRLSAEDLGSRINLADYMDEQGRLVGGVSKPVRDEYGVITGYEFTPYESTGASYASDAEKEQAEREMMVRQGRLGVAPGGSGIGAIPMDARNMVLSSATRDRPRYYSYAKGGLTDIAKDLASKGRFGDTMIAHISPQEAGLLKAMGGSGTINPKTGLPEYFSLFPKKGIKLNLGPLGNIKVGAKSSNLLQAAAALAIGDYYNVGVGLSSLAYGGVRAAATGNLAEGIQAGLTAYGMGSTYNQFADVPLGTPGAPAPVNVPGTEAAKSAAVTSQQVPMSPEAEFLAARPEFGQATNEALSGMATELPETTLGLGVGDPSTMSALERADIMTPPGKTAWTPPAPVETGSVDFGQGYLRKTLPASVQEYVPDFALDASGAAVATTGLLGASMLGSQQARDSAAQYAARDKEKKRKLFANEVAYLQGIPIYGASGGLAKLAGGGMTYMEAGGTTGVTGEPRDVTGTGDGMSDSVPASIEGVQEARLADGEFVIPADVVADIGNGSSDAGSKKLYDMMDRVRQARHGTTEQPPEIKAERLMPA